MVETEIVHAKIHAPRILMNRFIEGMTPKEMKRYTPQEQSDMKINRDADGNPVVPMSWILGCLRDAGKGEKYEGKATYSKLVMGGLLVTPEVIPIKFTEQKIYSTTVVNPATGGRMMAHRPEFDEVDFEFDITILNREFTAPILKKLLKKGGQLVGVGDYRPFFGRFEVQSVSLNGREIAG